MFFRGDSYALGTVLNIVDGGGHQRQAILDHDPLSCVRGLLSSPDSDIRGRACWAIATIISGSQSQLNKAFEYNLVPPLLQCLADADLNVGDSAARSVHHIASNGTYQQTQLLVVKGCTPLLCDLLAAEDASVVLVAVETVERILHAGESAARRNGLGTNPMAAPVSDAGGVAKIRALLRQRNSDAEHDFGEVAARVLAAYFALGDEGEEQGPDDIAVAAAAVGPSGEGDDEMEPPRQRPRLS